MGIKERKPWEVLDQYRGSVFSGEWPCLPALFEISAKKYPTRACFTINEGERRSYSYAEALAIITSVAGRLAELGFKPGMNIALTGKNSPEWAMAYLAILFAGCTVVPIDSLLKREEAERLVKAAEATGIFCDEEKYDYFNAAKELGIKALFSLSRDKDNYILDQKGRYALAEGQARVVEESDIAAILFTSGTTGEPKGVMLSHANLVADAFLSQANLPIYYSDVFYALLPIHHSYTMLAVFIEAIACGAEVVFAKRMAIAQIMKDLKESKITMLLSVPLLFNKLRAGIMSKIRDKGPIAYGLIRSLMFISGLIKKITGLNPGKRMFHSILEKANLSTLRICISGGGPLAPSVFSDFNRLGLDFVQGYGLTETSPIITLNPTEHYKPSSVGKIIPRMEFKILEPDSQGIGEIAVKGPAVMQGYYKNERATREILSEDGWLKTGDVGHIDSEGYVYLTGRAKNLIVTEGGKNVYPEEIENAFQLYPEVEQVLVRGFVADAAMKAEGIEALIFPAQEFFETEAKNKGLALAQEEVIKRIQAIIAEVNTRLLPYQRIARHSVLDKPLEMTTTKKIKRFSVNQVA